MLWVALLHRPRHLDHLQLMAGTRGGLAAERNLCHSSCNLCGLGWGRSYRAARWKDRKEG
jgi:hypothetical protein